VHPTESLVEGPGSYGLLMEPDDVGLIVRIGALGVLPLERCRYLYLGSARGPGGLRARLAHHVRRQARPHWHVDYLRRRCQVTGAWITGVEENMEHQWSARVARLPRAKPPLPGFGASDCSCATHLFALPSRLPLRAIGDALAASVVTGQVLYLPKMRLARLAG